MVHGHVQPTVALITGGTSGIGRATALALAQQGLEVVITGRDAARTEAAAADLQRRSGNPRVSFLLADLFRPAQVRALAGAFQAQHARLDVLVNNAGGTFTHRQLTPDGFERTWALNHLAPMELTLALLPLLTASVPARIVNVASGLYAEAIRFDDLQAERRYSTFGAYTHAKLANLLFTRALARRLAGTGVTVNAVNPGIVATDIARDARGVSQLINRLLTPLKKTPEQGAFPSVYLATAPEVEGMTGRFFNKTRFVDPRPVTFDEALQERLWQVSLQQLGRTSMGDAVPAVETERRSAAQESDLAAATPPLS
ncbi:SDR family NAD(P)-dependent oxidoreductase [Deinococcus sonorensis]|uniref:SDR family NAD(P)-dependent oxidoreductase n=2 Tax=Deinococcus sonorensis TaxID=309891 RepID=A0AAU7U6E5_9DEIO